MNFLLWNLFWVVFKKKDKSQNHIGNFGIWPGHQWLLLLAESCWILSSWALLSFATEYWHCIPHVASQHCTKWCQLLKNNAPKSIFPYIRAGVGVPVACLPGLHRVLKSTWDIKPLPYVAEASHSLSGIRNLVTFLFAQSHLAKTTYGKTRWSKTGASCCCWMHHLI